MKYSAVIFDWNGTLLDDVKFCHELLLSLLRENGLPPITFEKYLDIFRFPIKEYYRDAGFDFSKVGFETLADGYMPRYLSGYTRCSIFEGATALLDRLAAFGINRAVISVTRQDYLERQLKYYGLQDKFCKIIGLNDHYGGGKKELAENYISSFNFPREKVLFIGDTIHDKEVASALGADCILFSGGHQSAARLMKTGVPVFDSYAQIEKYIFNNK